MPLPTPRRVAAHGGGSARARIGALLFGLAFLLGAAEARAAAVCSNTPGANDWIRCTQTGTADIDIDLANPAISTTGPGDEGIWAEHTGTGNIDIDVTGGSIAAADANGVDARHEAAGAIDIDLTNVDVSTQGQLDYGVYAQHRGTSGTGIDIDVTGGSVTTAGSSAYGISANVNDATGVAVGAAISIDTKNTRVSTMGLRGYGVFGWINTVGSTAPVSVNVAGGSVTTAGENSHAVRAYTFSQTGTGAITVGVTDGAALSTTGVNAHGVLITQNGLAGIDADLTDAVISTANTSSYGFMGWLRNNSGSPLLDIDIVRGSVKTTGPRSYGILGYVSRNASASALSIDANGVAVSTTGDTSHGVFALSLGTGGVAVDLEDVAISTTGDGTFGIVGNIRYAVSTAAIAIDAAGDRAIAVEGLNAAGILGLQRGRGSVRVTTGAETSIEAPFAVGIEGRTTNDAGAAGRIVVTHGGAAEAREAGILAWAQRSSGHTFGAGAETADDAARTEPMIAVASSGTIAVGDSVMDAFIRDRIAGADETLSAAEQAVLNAVAAEDSDALDTALMALPAAYDDDWKAEARNLMRKRIAEPDAAGAANRAAEEILSLSNAGVRAVALSYTGIATFIRQGDRDPAIVAKAAASRTEQEQAALAEQEKLSAAERAVLTAVLTGGDLTAALAALPTSAAYAYTDDWKDGVRQRAASYNAGDIHVDITGGAVTAGGNGVEALYAVPHDRNNGAIAVTVAAGARVTGGVNGIYVRGAGVASGMRNQRVTVHGAAMGGTGAGVHMAGGGMLTVGANGEVGTVGMAPSGIGILGAGGDLTTIVLGTVTGDIRANGGGDLTATVRNGGAVTGDLRVDGGGALTATVEAGGAVTGTIRDPQASFTVSGSVGRVLYAADGAVTVAGGGKLTGVEGVAAESAAGALTVTVNDEGRVEGDVVSGGTLTADVKAGGVVTGTLHNPASPLTVSGSVGRILYDDGGTVTVAGGGAVTGVDNDGTTEAIRGDAGDLDVTVAANAAVTGIVEGRGAGDLEVDVAGAVTGDIAERGAGDLDVTVSGTVTGGVVGEGAGEHTVTVASSGAIAGTVRLPAGAAATIAGDVGRVRYDNGGAVTVNASGEITGLDIEGTQEAIRGDAGDLAVTVHGTVTGNIDARGDGDLTVKVSGTGTVAGEIFGRGGGTHTIEIAEKARVLGTVHNPKSGTTIDGAAGRVLFDNGGALTVAATGRIVGIGGEAIRAGAGNLEVTVASGGMVTGRVEDRGAGAMTVNVSGAVTGAIHGKGAGKHEVTVASGGVVTGDIVDLEAGDLVASVAGRVTGDIEERGAGDLTATVTGTVTGGIRGMGAGSHTVAVMDGGEVAGTVHLPTSAMTVAGRVGRVLYDNGGSVTVAATGRVAGVEISDGGREAIRSAAGDLSVTVAGRVEGDIRALGGGRLTLESAAGGIVTGTVHNPGSPMTVRGRIGRILYDNGGSVTVAGGGAVTGIENDGAIEAIRSAAGNLTVDVAAMATVTGDIRGEGDGDLDVDVSGTVKGGIFGLGGGEHGVHVKSGGAVEGLIHLAASEVTVDGAAASIRFDRGGTVEVGSGGRLSGLAGRAAVHSAAGDLTVTVNGNVTGSIEGMGAGNLAVTITNALTGDVIGGGGGAHRLTVASGAVFKGNVEGVESIRVAGRAEGTLDVPAGGEVTVPAGGALVGAADGQDRRVAVVAESGALGMTVNGEVEGDVEARDADADSTVTVGAGGAIDGKVALAGAGSTVEVDGETFSIDIAGGMVTVGENGRIEVGTSGRGAMTIRSAADESDEAATARVGDIARGIEYCFQRAGEDEICRVSSGGPLTFDRGPKPRHRVYEALPSVLLALNALPAHGDRFAAAGAPRGAFARFDASGGDRRPASSTAASRHDYRRFAFKAGIEGAVGERGVFAVSAHRVRGRADVETDGGRIEITGTGARISGAWLPAGDVYVSGQAAATFYEADLDSALDGALARDLSGRGYAVGVEAGRRFELGRVALTPRAGADWSMVEMSSFTDSANERVSLDAGRRVAARAGLRAETDALAGGAFATVDVERELSGAMRATAADRRFEADAEATWLRLGLGAAHEWADGRIALRAAANYAAARRGNRDFSGSAALTVRF